MSLVADSYRPRDRASFDGLLITSISYGALLMLCCQLVQSLYLRPKRGPKFYAMIAYSLTVFTLATVAVSGRFLIAEQQYIENRLFPDGSTAWFWENSDKWETVMTSATSVSLPWVSDLLVIYRIYTLYNRRKWIIAFPCLLYLAGVALSIPFILAISRPKDPNWAPLLSKYNIAYAAIMCAFNIVSSITLFVRLWMLRGKVEQVMGKVPAMMYNSPASLFVETGTFYSFWITCYLIVVCRNSFVQDVFLQSAVYVLGISRMLIIVRMVDNTAWTKDIVSASSQGVLDWQISSVQSHSIPMHKTRTRDSSSYPSSQEHDRIQKLPKKFRDDNMIF